MPDFIKKIQELQEKRNAERDAEKPKTVDEQFEQMFNPPPVNPLDQGNVDLSAVEYAGDESMEKTAVDKEVTRTFEPGRDYLDYDRYVDPNSFTPASVNDGFLKNTQTNFMYGLGQMIGDYGDIAQVVGSALPGIDMYEGNMLSRWLQEQGESIQNKNLTYLPEEVMNPDFSFKTFMNPDFWSTHGGRFLPQLTEIVATMGAGALAKKGVQKGLQIGFREMLEKAGKRELGSELAEGAGKKSVLGAFKTTTEGAYRGAKGIQEVTGTGKGLLGKVMTDRGVLTKSFGDLIENTTGGLVTNLRVSLANAGEVYNTYKDMKDEQGNDLFTKEELSQMASSTFSNNFAYVGMDILSWGMTFGKGWKANNGVSKLLGKIPEKAQAKIGSALATQSISPVFKKIASLGGKALKEGFEETIQETWEEWSKMRAYAEVNGSLEGYQGKISKNYDTNSPVSGFWDYYTSKDSESTRVIAGAMGALAGSAFNLKTLVDKQSDVAYKMQNRAENLKQIFEKGTDGKAWQDYHIRSQMAELVLENKGEQFADFATSLVADGKITEEEFATYGSLYDSMAASKAEMENLNIKGKKAYINNIMKEQYFNDSIQLETQRTENAISIIKENLKDNPQALKTKIAEEEKLLKQRITPLLNLTALAKENRQKLIMGKKANEVEFETTIDEFGNEVIVEKNTGDKKSTDFEKPKTLKGKALEMFNGIMDYFKSGENKEQEEALTSNENQNEPTSIEDKVEGSIDALQQAVDPTTFSQKATIGDLIDVDGEEATITGINKNSDDTVDSIDYEITPTGDNKPETEEEINSRKKTVRLTKNNTFFDDRKNKVLNISKKTKTEPEFDNEADNEQFNNVVDKISNDVPLNENEESFRQKHSNKVERALKNKKEIEAEAEQEIEVNETTSQKEAEYLKKAAKRVQKKSLVDDAKEFIKSLKEDYKKFKEGKLDDETPDLFADGRESRISTIKDFVTLNAEKKEKINSFFSKLKNSYQEYSGSLNDKLNEVIGPEEDHLSISQSIAINDRLEALFPDLKPRVYAVENMMRAVGKPALGYTLAGAIYIDEKSWKQDNVFMHEMSHIYYDLTKDTLETQAMMNFALQNESLVQKIYDRYEDQIEYKKNDTGRIIKRHYFFGEDWDSLTYEEREAQMQSLINEGIITELPLKEQSVISEEVFAATLEGPLSDKFNKFFEPKQEVKRQFYAKKWWGSIKKRADKAQDNFAYSQSLFIENLTDKQLDEFANIREVIFNNFQNEIKGKDVSGFGRAKAIEEEQKEITERLNTINKQIGDNVSEHLGKQKTFNKDADAQLNDFDDNVEDNSFENQFEINRIMYVTKASRIIRDFAKNYNKVLRRRYYNLNKNKATNWNQIPVFNRDLLTSKLFELAKISQGSPDFIRRIEDSDVDELFEFNEFLNAVREDKQMLLQSMFYVYKNQSNINSVQSYVDKKGNFVVQNSLNNREIALTENVLDSVYKSVGAYNLDKINKPTSRFYLNKYADFKKSADKIRSGNYDKLDIYNFLEFFSSGNIDYKSMIKENRLNINGKNYALDRAIRAFLLSENGLKNDSIYVLGQNRVIRPGVRTFIQSIVATNRKFTADFTTQNAEGNQEPVRVIDSFLTRELETITSDAKRLNKTKFMEKYSHLSKRFKEGSRSNQLLSYIYDNVSVGKEIGLSQFHGVKNDDTGGASVLKNSNQVEQSLNDFFSFIATIDKNKKSYLMETGRFSDSPRSFMLEVPKINLSDVGTLKGNVFKFNSNAKALVFSAYNTYRSLGNDITIEEFAKSINDDINSEIKFIEENKSSVMRINEMKKYMKDGKLNENGRNLVAEYVVNQSFNGTYFNEIFFPSFPIKDRDKRAKSGISPGFALGNHVQLEPIYFVDEYVNGKETTDAAIYILEDDAKRLEEAGGNIMPMGKGYKVLQTGIEHENKNFKGKNLYDKGYATILNDEVVEQNPKLKGLYELMKKRREQYQEKTGSFEKNLLTGIPTHFLYAAPLSSNKSNNLPVNMLDSENNPTEHGIKFTLDTLNSSDFKEQNEFLDEMYYDKDHFFGINGKNFVVQQIMDKETVSSNTPVQMIRALVTNASVNGQMENAEKMQSLIAEMQQDNLKYISDILNEGSEEEIRKLIIDSMDMELIDPLQRFQIEDGLSINTPALREIVKNTLSNIVKRNGNKLKTPGTIAQQKPALYSKKYGKTNGTNGLAFYTEKANGGLVKGECIVPSYMNVGGSVDGKPNPNKLIARQVLTINDKVFTDKYPNVSKEESLEILKREATSRANSRGVGIGNVYSDDNVLIGYYVEGDTIIATRIPAHGPQSTGVFEVIDFDTTGGSQVQLPFEFAGETTGGDFDGDQVFIQHKGKGAKWNKWNEVMKMIEEHWLSPEMAKEIQLGIEFKEDAENAIQEIEKVYGKNAFENPLHFSPRGRRISYNNTLISKGNIGITANLHGLIGMLSAYNTEIGEPITINKKTIDKFQDSKEESRTINSAKIFNIILDNAKYGFADKLGLNEHTVSHAIILRNLGFDLGEIGVILNSPVVKEWSKIMSNKENVFSGPSSIDNIEGLIRSNLKMSAQSPAEIVINTNNILDPDSQNSVLKLISYLSTMTDDINKISKIMSGHKELETNPFVMQQQINDFDNVINNKSNGSLIINSDFKNNPLIKNYNSVAQFNLETLQKLDPVFRKDGSFVYDKILSGTTRKLSKVMQKQLHNDIEVFYTSRLLGFNNIPEEYMNELISAKNPKNIFNRLSEHVDRLSSQIIKKNEKNILKSVSAKENNLLFSKALRYSLKGNNQFISLNNGFFNETMSNEERDRVIGEFNELPNDLKNDLVLYDLIQNGFKGPQSLFHLFDKDFKKMISDVANYDIKQKESNALSAVKKDILIKKIVQKNPDFFSSTTIHPFVKSTDGKTVLNPDLSKNKALFNKIKNGVETIFKFKDANNKEHIIHFKGWENSDIAELKQAKNNKDLIYAVSRLAKQRITYYSAEQGKGNIGLISIKDDNSLNPIPYRDTDDTAKSWEDRVRQAELASENEEDYEGREMRNDYYRFTQTLNRKEFDYVMEFKEEVSDIQRNNLFDAYLEDKRKADSVYLTVNEQTVKKNTNDELIELYSKYGDENKFAYAKVLRAISMEVANRVSAEQSKLTGKEYDGKDIGLIKSWLMSNNVPSNHPAVQGMVKEMEIQYKNYIEEKNKYVSKINQATDNLYKETFGFSITSTKPMDMLKSLYYGIFKDKDAFYKKLYGPLITYENVTNEKGETITNMKYKTEEVIEQDYKSGAITEAQYNFYKTTREISKELEPFALQGKKGRQDYIPHTAPATMEKLSKRGLLGLMVNSKTIDQQIYDVTMSVVNPITGKMEDDVPFKTIEDWYNTISKHKGSEKQALEFVKLKRKAIVLYRKGINQNGTPIRYSNIEMGSAVGDVFMDRFSKGRSVAAADFPSSDLNKAFVDYVGATLFTNGNERFQGFKKMLPVIDGILAQADRNGDKNMEQYVDKIWKQYFLSGKKQEILPNIAELEAIGLSSDKVVDYITKGSLIYWLGYKGLLIGGGAYAIGNVLIGKFNNITSVGGETWLKGEKRFWAGKDGKFNPLNPFKGTKEANAILKKMGFMDLNVWDDVNVEGKNAFEKMFSSFALMPMTYSEKWIQGVQMLGMLTDEEWEQLKDDNGTIMSKERLVELEDAVKLAHGKGYQATDQRMIQMYSWGRALMQFSRYIPTVIYNNFSKEDIDRYGKKTMGTYTALFKTVQKGINGEWTPATFMNYRRSLDSYERSKLDSALCGFGILSALMAINHFAPSEHTSKLIGDANIHLDGEKLASKLTPASVRMFEEVAN